MNTHPRLWAAGVFLFLILFLPLYMVARVRYKRLLAQRRVLLAAPNFAGSEDVPGVWPPPPQMPMA